MNNFMLDFINHWSFHQSKSYNYIVDSGQDYYRIIIENTCEWYKVNNGCTVCNYTSHSGINATEVLSAFEDEIINKLIALNLNYDRLKLYINGSFFNEKELDFSVAIHFIQKIRDLLGIEILQVESRPEFVKREIVLKYINATKLNFEISFGVESTNNIVRNVCLHKGGDIDVLNKAIDEIKDLCRIKIYLLIKSPFLTEAEAIEDIISSVDYFMSQNVDFISCTPVAVQENTLLEFLLQENLYRPVWIWSIIEINTRLKKKYGEQLGKKVKISGLDYYPEPLALAFNCEKCSNYLIDLLKDNGNLTWDDIKDFDCDCIYRWKDEIQSVDERTIESRVSKAHEVFINNISRTEKIKKRINSITNIHYLTDVAKQVPANKMTLDEVGIYNLSLPLKCSLFFTSDATISLAISLDEFHRGIHMSRLVEAATQFSRDVHNNLISETKDLLINIANANGGSGYVNLKTKIYLDNKTPLTDKSSFIMVPLEIDISKDKNRENIIVKVSIPIINACPCTLLTSYELLDKTETHTQRGTISIEFINCCNDFTNIVPFIYQYSSILDILKREDELRIVDNAFSSASFCEDICRDVISNLKKAIKRNYGEIIVTVMTEESIHPHNAYAKKRYQFNEKYTM